MMRFVSILSAATMLHGGNFAFAGDVGATPISITRAVSQRRVEIFNEMRDAVVRIRMETIKKNGEQTETMVGIGTGFFISAEGHVATSDFGIADCTNIWVEHRNLVYPASILGCDPRTRCAILKLNTRPTHKPSFVNFSENAELPVTASTVFSLSCQMGLDVVPREGIVAGQDLRYFDHVLPTTHLRVGLEALGGDTGGAIFDIDGNFVGMIAVALPELKASLILPAKAIRRVRDDILFYKAVRYAYFGIEVEPTWDERTKDILLKITKVTENSPADKAGVKPDDKLIRIAGNPVRDIQDVFNAFFFARPDTRITLTLQRNGHVKDVSVKPTVTP